MRSSRCRSLAVAAGATVAAALLAHQLLGELRRPAAGTLGLDALVLRACLLALLACLAWGWLAVLACVADAWRASPREQRPGVPAGLRRLVFLACGVTLAAAAPALAATDHGQDPEAAQIATLIAGLPLPDRTTDVDPGARQQPSTRSDQKDPTHGRVEVRPGDSLWRITERLLPDADVEAVARGWNELYRANRELIGADPGVILPGMALTVPDALAAVGSRR